MMLDRLGREATPGERGECPSCGGELLAKCGSIVCHHWAHRVADCDPWAEPESEWHLGWKRWFRDHRNAGIEVVMPPHRADVRLPSGEVVELQSTYLSVEQIAERERFYAPMRWVYRCTWADRLHFGERGFWWKHGAQSMATHRWPVWWDLGDGEVWKVKLSVVQERELVYESPDGPQVFIYGHRRVLGRILTRIDVASWGGVSAA